MSIQLNNPYPFFYCVQPGQFFAGEHPTWSDTGSSLDRIWQLLEAGVTYFLDLTQEGEEEIYLALLNREASKSKAEIEYRRLPIRDRTVPEPETMVAILDTLDAALVAGHKVYVHCYAGIGRTGTVVGCYLVRHGMSGKAALDEISRLRREMRDGVMPSPHTREQQEMVLNWPVGK